MLASEDHKQELGGSTLPKGRTCTQVRGSIRSSRWIAVHLQASFARRVTGCARPRGSARTSRYVCRSSWAVLAPNKFSERAAKTAADESEREPRWFAVPGLPGARLIEESSRLRVVAAKGHNHGGKAQGGVMSATRRCDLSREDRVACLARCRFGRPGMSGTGSSEGSSRMEVALGYGQRPSSRMGRKK